MNSALRISLKAGERIYINGAVLRTDRKVTIDILNEVTFLLEQHVMKPEDTTTPLRQLYFMVQTMLIDPAGAGKARDMAKTLLAALAKAVVNRELLAGLAAVSLHVEEGKPFDALKAIRMLYPIEAEILARMNEPGEVDGGSIDKPRMIGGGQCK